MTAQALQAPAAYTPFLGAIPTGNITTAVGSNANFTFNAAGDKIAFVFQAPSATVPDIVAFRCDTVTTAGTAGAVDCTLETLDTAGLPSGTPVTGSATASVTFSTVGVKTASGLSGTATVTQGTQYAIVLTAGAGWDRALTLLVSTGESQGALGMPYNLTKDTAGAWTKRIVGPNLGWCIGLAAAGGTYLHIPGLGGAYSDASLQAFNDATNPDERGNRFSLPFPATIYGALVMSTWGSAPGANDNFSLSIYTSHTSATPTQAETIAIDGDAQVQGLSHVILFDTGVDIAANTVFALAIKAAGTEDANMVRWTYASNAHLASHLGTNVYSTTRNNATGAFTDNSTMVYGIYPLISKLDDGAGGGVTIAGTPMLRGMV